MEDSSDDNISRQIEEQEALKSIYGDEWQQEADGGSCGITLTEGALSLQLFITITDVYPGQGPPLFQILAPSLSRTEMVEITNILQDIYLNSIGETVIFQWIEKAREWLQDKISPRDSKHSSESELQYEEHSPEEHWTSFKNQKEIDGNSSSEINIIHGDPISFKKSTFQGHVATIMSTDQVKQVITQLMENKKVANATHNMYAYRIYREDAKSFSQDCEDDGETQAGGRLLHLLQIMDVRNIIVVVSRWYGGVHLGPDRFRLINNAARQVIEKANLLPNQELKKKN